MYLLFLDYQMHKQYKYFHSRNNALTASALGAESQQLLVLQDQVGRLTTDLCPLSCLMTWEGFSIIILNTYKLYNFNRFIKIL
jgi:hypothetical protein